MIGLSLALAGLLTLIVLMVLLVVHVWTASNPATRARREVEDAYDAVDDVLMRARSEMEHVAYWGKRARQPMSDNFGNWKGWWS